MRLQRKHTEGKARQEAKYLFEAPANQRGDQTQSQGSTRGRYQEANEGMQLVDIPHTLPLGGIPSALPLLAERDSLAYPDDPWQ